VRLVGNSLRSRLFQAIVLIVVLSVGLTLAIGLVLTRRTVDQATLDDVAHQADLIARRERSAIAPLAHLADVRAFLAEQNGRVETVLLTTRSPYLPEDAREELLAGAAGVRGSVEVDGKAWYFAAERVVGQRGLVLLRPHRAAASDWRPYLEGLVIAGLAGVALAALASLVLARRIARPVGRAAEASRRLAAGSSPDPLPVEGVDELATLASSFNDLASQLARAKEAERSFLLSVSHELKTPLTVVRGYAEALQEGAALPVEAGEAIERDAARLERLVGDLLDLGRLNRSEFAVHPSEVDLWEVAAEAVQRFEAQAAGFGVGLGLDGERPSPAFADADRVLQVVSNLVENALRVTPPHGRVRIVVSPGRLAVEDTGPGLEQEELEHAFDRFYLWSRYGRERRVGTGLGLAIVKELTRAMNGAVEVSSEPRRGTVFTVRLPWRPDQPLDGGGAGLAGTSATSSP
jgi:two-component system sensor histidine kinase BaeS